MKNREINNKMRQVMEERKDETDFRGEMLTSASPKINLKSDAL